MGAIRVVFRKVDGSDFTGMLGAYWIEKGRYVATIEESKLEKLQRVLTSHYGMELEHGPGAVQKAAERGQADADAGGVRSDADESAQAGADERPGAVGGSAASAGSVPSGDRHEHARNDGTQEFANRLRKAVMSLDKKNDEHWTSDGRPRVDAVEKAYGNGAVTRADVERVASGYTRDAA